MAYPIQENFINDNVTVAVTGTASITLNDWVVSVNGSFGQNSDPYYSSLEPAMCSVELYDVTSTVDAALIPGNTIRVLTGPTYFNYLFVGEIRDVQVSYSWNDVRQAFVATHTLSCADYVSDAGNVTIPAKTFLPSASEDMTVAQFYSQYYAATGLLIEGMSSIPAATYVNQFSDESNAVEVVDQLARSINRRAYSGLDLSTGDGSLGITDKPNIASLSQFATITDGTHNPATTGLIWGMTDIDYGYSSKEVISELTLNNVGLNHAPKSATDNTVEDITTAYTTTQSVGFKSKASLDTMVQTDNLGWNLLSNTGSEATSPQGIWPADYFSYGMSPTMTLNSHQVAVATVTTAFSSRALPLMSLDTQNTFVTTPPGGMTGNWNVQFKIRTVTTTTVPMFARIIWYNSAGTALRTDSGTSTAVNSTTWTTVTYSQASPPAGAVTAVAYAVVNGAAAVGYQFYITEAMFTRAGASSTFFNGDTADTATLAYSWTGTVGNSPSQKSDATNLSSLSSTILARNTAVKKVRSVTINAQEIAENSGTLYPGISPIEVAGQLAQIVTDADTQKNTVVGVAIAGSSYLWKPVGYSFDMTPKTFNLTLNLTTTT